MPRRNTAAQIARDGIARGAADWTIIDELQAAFGFTRTPHAVTVAYYRAEARREAARTQFVDAQFVATPAEPFALEPFAVGERPDFDAAELSERPFGMEFEFVHSQITRQRGMGLDDFGQAVRAALAPWPEQVVVVSHRYGHSNGRSWDLKLDGSCEFELATPRLTRADWPKVVAVLAALKATGVRVDDRCGVHVHHETRGLRLPHLRNLIRLWGALDEPLHSSLPESRRANRYAERMDAYAAERLAAMDAPRLRAAVRRGGRYVALNLLKWWRAGRIEVRSHHGTLDAAKAGWWLKITQAIVDRAAAGRVDEAVGGINNGLDRFARVARVAGRQATRVLATWARNRNAAYFDALAQTERQAA